MEEISIKKVAIGHYIFKYRGYKGTIFKSGDDCWKYSFMDQEEIPEIFSTYKEAKSGVLYRVDFLYLILKHSRDMKKLKDKVCTCNQTSYVPLEWEDRFSLSNTFIVDKHRGSEHMVVGFSKDAGGGLQITLAGESFLVHVTAQDLFNRYTHLNGAPCGKIV